MSLNAIYSFLYGLEKMPHTLRPTSGKGNFSKTIIHTPHLQQMVHQTSFFQHLV